MRPAPLCAAMLALLSTETGAQPQNDLAGIAASLRREIVGSQNALYMPRTLAVANDGRVEILMTDPKDDTIGFRLRFDIRDIDLSDQGVFTTDRPIEGIVLHARCRDARPCARSVPITNEAPTMSDRVSIHLDRTRSTERILAALRQLRAAVR